MKSFVKSLWNFLLLRFEKKYAPSFFLRLGEILKNNTASHQILRFAGEEVRLWRPVGAADARSALLEPRRDPRARPDGM